MVNYNDPDYVHWGYLPHYTRGIAVMDEGLRQIVSTVEADPEYRDNTVFVIVPVARSRGGTRDFAPVSIGTRTAK